MGFKPSDVKLLKYLYHHNRESLTGIAKKLHLSREQVEYRIQKYQHDGIIKQFLPVVNYAALGYPLTTFLFLRYNKKASLEQFKRTCGADKNTLSYGELLAQYDLYLVLAFQDEAEKATFLAKTLADESITDHLVLEPHHITLYPLKFIGGKESDPYLITKRSENKEKIDAKDVLILKALQHDARIKSMEIAKKTNLTAEVVAYRLKQLQQKGILLGSRAHINMEKAGFFYTLLFLDIKHYSHRTQLKLQEFAKEQPHIDTIGLSFTKPNYYLQLFHKEETELRKTIEELKELLREEHYELSIIPLKNAGENIRTLPFL